jgi:endonuclease-3
MAVNRSALLVKTHKVLKKHYNPVAPNLRLPLMQQLLYACCLENATDDVADKALAALENQYYDLNEVRVSTATELSESIQMLPDPIVAGNRTRQILQSVFETNYSFDLEQLKKENIGVAVKKLKKLRGATPFAISYVTQVSLCGHSIPVSSGASHVFYVIGVITAKEKKNSVVPGLERAIPKDKGVEFGSMLNQLGAEFMRAPHGPVVRKILLRIAPDAKERLPKRRGTKQASPASAKQAAAKKGTGPAKASIGKKPPKTENKSPAAKKPVSKKKKVAVTTKAKGQTAVKKKPPKKAVKRKVAKQMAAKKRVSTKKTSAKSSSLRLSKRKPR